MDTLLKDLRFALRLLRKSPAFSIVAIATLALGIGANTAIFSIVNAILLRPLPYADSERLVKIVPEIHKLQLRDVGIAVPELQDLQADKQVFQDVSAVWPISANLTGGERPERIEVLVVSPNYFSMLGATPQVGRVFGTQDKAEGFAEAVVISDAIWHRLFGGDKNVLGHKIQIDNDAYSIVGVLPPEFRHPGSTVSNDVEVWCTAGFLNAPFPAPNRAIRMLPSAIAKLAPGVSLAQGKDRIKALANRLQADYPNDYPAASQWTMDLDSLQESLVGKVRPMLLMLLGTVALIILVATVNIANLLLARAAGRQREIAVRVAIGATRSHIIRQMLAESLVLALIGGLVGILTATFGLQAFVRYIPAAVPRVNSITVDWRVLTVALVLSVLSGILFGLSPALQALKDDVVTALREGTAGAGYSRRTARMRGMLIASELAIAVVLVVGAGLLLRTFWKILQEDPGFNPTHVVSASIWLPRPNDPTQDLYLSPAQSAVFVREVVRRVQSLPGTQSVAVSTHLPVTAVGFRSRVTLEGASQPLDFTVEPINVTPDYFSTMQLPFMRGDRFTENEKQDLVVIDETAARRFWPNQNPIGKQLRYGNAATTPWMTVSGVVRNSRQDGLDVASDIPHIYRSIYQINAKELHIVVRTTVPAATIEPQIRSSVESIDSRLPVFNVRGMDEVISNSLASRRFSATLVGCFAILALVLAVIGIYGLLTYMVGQRAHELAVRVALGAQRSHIRSLIVGYALRIAGLGIAAGLVLALILARTISSLLVDVRTWDPVVFLAVPSLLLFTALLASYLPAWRASKVAPMNALQNR